MIFTLSFLLFIAQTCLANETCQNFPTTIRPKSFREGEWIDQVRVYSASQSHPKSTVSLFLAHYQTYCGFYELNVLSADSFILYKGYYASRFYEHFYPFKAQITRSRDELNCKISLEQRECEYYRDLKRAVTDVNILYTDYKSMMIIHQCVDSRNYLMLVTRNDHFTDEDKAGIEKVLVDIMQDYKILIENQTFWWPTRDLCADHIDDIFPTFYRKIYIDRNQSACPSNLTVVVELTDLKDFWKNKMERIDALWEERKTILYCTLNILAGTTFVVGAVAILNDNYKP